MLMFLIVDVVDFLKNWQRNICSQVFILINVEADRTINNREAWYNISYFDGGLLNFLLIKASLNYQPCLVILDSYFQNTNLIQYDSQIIDHNFPNMQT